jgi:hypothetical protein
MTHEEAISITGPIADHFLAEILQLQPLAGELIEAASRVRGVDPAGMDLAAAPRVARLCAILEAAEAADADPLALEERD